MPDAATGLPKSIERRLMRRFSGSGVNRVLGAAVLHGASVLVRDHPRAVLHVAAAASAQAGRASYGEARNGLARLGRRLRKLARRSRRRSRDKETGRIAGA